MNNHVKIYKINAARALLLTNILNMVDQGKHSECLENSTISHQPQLMIHYFTTLEKKLQTLQSKHYTTETKTGK